MSYFDYLKENVYKTFTKEITLSKNQYFIFENKVNIIKITIPNYYKNRILSIRTNENGLTYNCNFELCDLVLEYLQKNNFYQSGVLDIFLPVDNNIINNINNPKIKIEYTYDKLYKRTEIKYYSSVLDKLKYTNKLYVLNRIKVDDYRFNLINKNKSETSYLYEIDLDKIRDLDENANIISYIRHLLFNKFNNNKTIINFIINTKLS
jgi:hypothetical protein